MQALRQYRKIGVNLRQQQEADPKDFHVAHHRPRDHDIFQRTLTSATTRPDNDDHASVEPVLRLTNGDNGSSLTAVSSDLDFGPAIDGVEVRDRTTKEGKGSLVFVVSWAERDVANPRNWSFTRRFVANQIVGLIGFACMVASSIDSAVAPQAAARFHVTSVVESLATAMFLIGSGVGSLFAGPFSETFGRLPVYLGSLLMMAIWVMASALSPNITGQIIFRFFVGFFGCAPLTCSGGTISDLWGPIDKIWGFLGFALLTFGGPILGPVIGAFMYVDGFPSWRWVDWITLILVVVMICLTACFLPETHPAIIQSWKAKQLRQITSDDRFLARIEIMKVSFWHRMQRAVYRPFVLAKEAIVVAITCYMTIIWCILFTFLDGYTTIFQEPYGTSQGLTNTIFVAMYVGALFTIPLTIYLHHATVKESRQQLDAGIDNVTVRPETRLWWAMYGGAWSVPVSLFWLAWTTYPSISIWSGIVSTTLFGYGLVTILVSTYLYIIDAYEVNAASALTFCTIVRYLVSGGLVVAGVPFYEKVGRHWTVCILAVFSAMCAPVPFILYKYGPKIRQRSRNCLNKS